MMKIKQFREKNKMKQEEIAVKIGVDRSTIAKWETGAAKPRADKLPALAKILNCTVDQLLKED